MEILIAVGLLVGIIVGAFAGIYIGRSRGAGEAALAREKSERVNELEKENDELAENNSRLREENSALKALMDEQEKSTKEKLKLLDEARENLSNAFKSIATKTLEKNNESFLQLAKTSMEKVHGDAKNDLEKREKAIEGMVKPLRDQLKDFSQHVKSVEEKRAEAYTTLREQVKVLSESQQRLNAETGNLVKALRRPEVRGKWGEITLRRVAELAGMVEYCDFKEQYALEAQDGSKFRPDMVVQLPGGRQVIIDAKTPLDAYLDAEEATADEDRASSLQRHAEQVMGKLRELSKKQYQDHLSDSALFVVMFLPAETFLRAALDKYPDLIEEGFKRKVIIATPSTLISLLLTVAHGWKQEALTKHAEEIRDKGQVLYDRLCTFSSHMNKLGRNLERSVETYNKTVGSLERMVLPGARKFKDLGVSTSSEIKELGEVDLNPRRISEIENNE